MVTATRRLRVVTYLREHRRIGTTRACRLVGVSRASYAYVSRRLEQDVPVRAQLRAAAVRHPRWGAPRLTGCCVAKAW